MPQVMYTEEEVAQIVKGTIEDRAEWFLRLYFGFKKLDPAGARKIAEEVIREFGVRKAGKMKLPPDATAREFVESVDSGPAKLAFDMKAVKLDDDESSVLFFGCPFMDVFEKLGCTDDEKEELCEVANCGDFGMISCFPGLELDFPEMLSRGGRCCHMHVVRKR
ncbi:MAG: L-2-amino-thiazoline-4-carboxylic acid hydrolase [Synergistaceae bacterium]|nr:L-2-amino-thiazoline-4-carboxylic acid hydrolase [Synergistaceae bacterium]